jgi:hypothetical protein
MVDPLRSLDRWASQSVDRSALLMWLLVIALGVFVALAIAGEVWYTQPPPPGHLSQNSPAETSG